MILDNSKKNIIFKEFNDQQRIKYFDIRAKKVLHKLKTERQILTEPKTFLTAA